MPKVPLSEARPGQKLVRPVVTRTGMLMIQPGTELTDTIIARLQTIGIDSVYVEGDNPGGDKPVAVLMQELDERFAGHERDAWMMELKAVVARHLRDGASPATHD
jgi:hypothetical protein